MRIKLEISKFFLQKTNNIFETMLHITGNTPQERFLSAVKELKLRFPVKEICEKTGYSDGTVSGYMNDRKVSPQFVRKFSEAFGLDFYLIWEGKKVVLPDQKGQTDSDSDMVYKYMAILEKYTKLMETNSSEMQETLQTNQARLVTLFQHLAKIQAQVEKRPVEKVQEEMNKALDANFRNILKMGSLVDEHK